MGLIEDRLRRLLVALGIRRRLMRRADRARDAGAFAEAVALYERVLRLTPQDARIHIQAGHMVKEAGDLARAERHYRAAIAAAPEDRDAPLHLAHLLKNSGRLREAHVHFCRLSALDPAAGDIAALADETLVAGSGLFDPDVYRLRNPDLKSGDLYRHFIDHGLTEARPASLLFDVEWYLARYPQVRGAPGGPMLDYLRHLQGTRDPNPFFSNRTYLAALGGRDTGGLAPLVHYLEQGAAEGLPALDAAHPAFDAVYYATVYPDVRASGLPPLAHFLRIGLAEGRYPKARPTSPIDLFEDTAIAAPVPASPERITGEAEAVRFLVALLRARPDLRQRFPDALSAGAEGAFAVWLAGEGAAELGLSGKALASITAAFRADPGARIRQIRLTHADVARAHLLALTPAGAGDLLAAVAADGTLGGEPIDLAHLWWFLLTVAEKPADGLVKTFMFTPVWQRLFPDGMTVFGRRRLGQWLVASFGIAGDWTDPARWPEPFTPVEQIRIAYAARADWRAAYPAPFDTGASAAFLVWLGTPAAGLDEEATAWLARQDRAALATALAVPGFNMLGHFCYASGLRTSAETLVEGFRRTGGTVSLRDVWVQRHGDEDRHAAYAGLEVHNVTIIHTQPEPLFNVAYDRAGLAPRTPRTYRIGYWYWELETIPAHWQAQADQVDEIWAATRFVGDALKERFDLPVHVIMPGLEHPVFERRSRAHFGLPEGTYLFLFTFHMASIMERKNPLGLIEAFIMAFGKDEGGVGLVLKTSFGHMYPEQLAQLQAAGAGYNVIILDAVYAQGDVLALMDSCDAYVSLHRSEGYGLTMAEAMLLGKPVIATAYSGNLDFMTEETSLLVRHELVTLDRDYPPYRAGTRWAHASLTHAAECMRKVRDNPEWACALGAKAKADLATRMSFETSGRKVTARISAIKTVRSQNA